MARLMYVFSMLFMLALLLCACQPIQVPVQDAALEENVDTGEDEVNQMEPQWPILVTDDPDNLYSGIRAADDGTFCVNQNGFAFDAEGNLWFAYTVGSGIRQYDSLGVLVAEWGQTGSGPGEFDFSLISHQCLAGDVAIGLNGDIYVVDPGNKRVQKFGADGRLLLEWGGEGMDDGQFMEPFGVATDAAGNVYVTDRLRTDIQKFDAEGNFLLTFLEIGSAEVSLLSPAYVEYDAEGEAYAPSTGNDTVLKYDDGGRYLTQWGASGKEGGQFQYPMGIAVDDQGNVYVTDMWNHRVQQFDREGNFLSMWGEFGIDPGQFMYPYYVAVDPDGVVYVGDLGGVRIQRFAWP